MAHRYTLGGAANPTLTDVFLSLNLVPGRKPKPPSQRTTLMIKAGTIRPIKREFFDDGLSIPPMPE